MLGQPPNNQNAPPQLNVDSMSLEQPPLEAFPWDDDLLVNEAKATLRDQISAAATAKGQHHEQVRRNRAYYELSDPNDRTPAWDGGANIMAPLVRGKLDAIAPILVDALWRDPLGVLSAYDPNLDSTRMVVEAFLDRICDHAGTRSTIAPAVLETLLTPCAIWKAGVQNQDDSVLITNDLVRFEDFLVNPATVRTLEDAYFVADRFHQPFWRLLEMYAEGTIQDPARLANSDNPPPAGEYHDREGHNVQRQGIAKEARYIELYECWWRWKQWQTQDDEGVTREGNLWHVWYHAPTQTILLAEPNPHWVNRPPYALATIQERLNSIFGYTLAEILESMQLEMNATLNMRLDANAYANGPMFLVDEGTKAGKLLMSKGMQPGLMIPHDGSEQDPVKPVVLPGANPNTLQDIATIRSNADWATIADSLLGQAFNNQITATEINQKNAQMQIKTKLWLEGLRAGLEDLLWLNLQMGLQYMVAPAGPDGIPFVTRGGDQTALRNEDMRLDEFDLKVNGSEVRTARVEKAQITQALMQSLMPYIVAQPGPPNPDGSPGGTMPPLVNQLPVWTMCKHLLDGFEVQDWEQIIGPKPPSAAELAAMAQQQQALEHIADRVQAVGTMGADRLIGNLKGMG